MYLPRLLTSPNSCINQSQRISINYFINLRNCVHKQGKRKIYTYRKTHAHKYTHIHISTYTHLRNYTAATLHLSFAFHKLIIIPMTFPNSAIRQSHSTETRLLPCVVITIIHLPVYINLLSLSVLFIIFEISLVYITGGVLIHATTMHFVFLVLSSVTVAVGSCEDSVTVIHAILPIAIVAIAIGV